MIILIASVILLGIIVAIITHFRTHDDEDEQPIVVADTCDTCDGTNTKCERECMMEASLKDIEYFDDEELDEYKGRNSDEYSDEEADQFEEVLTTLRPEEVADWVRSLTLREVNLPSQIKDEVIMMLDEKIYNPEKTIKRGVEGLY